MASIFKSAETRCDACAQMEERVWRHDGKSLCGGCCGRPGGGACRVLVEEPKRGVVASTPVGKLAADCVAGRLTVLREVVDRRDDHPAAHRRAIQEAAKGAFQ